MGNSHPVDNKDKNAKKRSAPSEPEPNNKHVYVVTRIAWHHDLHYGSSPERKIMGIYATKDIAAREAGSMDSDTLAGNFVEALKEYRIEFDNSDYDESSGPIDNRRKPPSSGILMKFGHENEEQGDYVSLEIETFPLIESTKLKISEPSKKRKTNNDAEGSSDDG